MYYITATEYVGPNQDQANYIDADTIEISTEPARTNMSNEIEIDGWCGTTNDFAVYAHGEYNTLDEARDAIKDIFGDVRDHYVGFDYFESDDENVIEVYKPGQYQPMTDNETGDWLYESIHTDINADTSDEQMDKLVTIYESEANSEGYTLGNIEKLMEQYRLELKWEVEAEA